MTIEQLDKAKLLISLCRQDMQDFSLNFDTLSLSDEHSRMIVMRLLRLACTKTGIPYSSRTLLVEALPHTGGCMLFVTLMDKGDRRKTYRVKRLSGEPCIRFYGIDSLLSAADVLSAGGIKLHRNSLWLFEGEYYLLMDYPLLSKRARGLLSEYGRSFICTEVYASRIRESGKLLCGENAMSIIGEKVSQ